MKVTLQIKISRLSTMNVDTLLQRLESIGIDVYDSIMGDTWNLVVRDGNPNNLDLSNFFDANVEGMSALCGKMNQFGGVLIFNFDDKDVEISPISVSYTHL